MRPGPKPNPFLESMTSGGVRKGFWLSLGSAGVAEVAAGAGFDFVVLDSEHSPVEAAGILAQMRVLDSLGVHPVVRPVWKDAHILKKFLDIGAQTLLIPYVETAEEMRTVVAATRYPPEGERGVSMAHRSNAWGRDAGYFDRAAGQLCLIPQIETRKGMRNLDEILAVDGVGAVFVGPADLSADLGHPGKPGHPDLVAALRRIAEACTRAGMGWGTLVADAAQARERFEMGAAFVAAGTDSGAIRVVTDAAMAALSGIDDRRAMTGR